MSLPLQMWGCMKDYFMCQYG